MILLGSKSRYLVFGSEAWAGRKDFMEDRNVENIYLGKLGSCTVF